MDNHTCEWCECEFGGEGHVLVDNAHNTTIMCDDCHKGVHTCTDCGGDWYHEDTGITDEDSGNIDGRFYCAKCYEAKKEEQEIEEKHGEAFIAFAREAEEIGYDYEEILSMLDNNWEHGAYMRNHGGTSTRIVNDYIEEAEHEEDEIIAMIDAMGGAEERHSNTIYDDLMQNGETKESAREYINQ